jgi:hypothetical protein
MDMQVQSKFLESAGIMEIVSSGATLRKRIFSICGGPNSVGSPYNQPRLARSRISLCATTDRNDRLAIRPNDQTKPAWGAGFCLLGWRGWRALPLQALTQFVNIHIRDASSGRAVAAVSADMRGNSDDSWSRTLDRLIRNRLLAPGYGARQ